MLGLPGMGGSRVILRLLAAGQQMRTILGRRTRAAEARAMVDSGDVQPGDRVSSIVAAGDHDAGRLDAVAGCEFVDDRIRLRE